LPLRKPKLQSEAQVGTVGIEILAKSQPGCEARVSAAAARLPMAKQRSSFLWPWEISAFHWLVAFPGISNRRNWLAAARRFSDFLCLRLLFA